MLKKQSVSECTFDLFRAVSERIPDSRQRASWDGLCRDDGCHDEAVWCGSTTTCIRYFVIAEHAAYQAREYQIEPDVSAASYFMRCARLSAFLQRSAMYTGKAYREILLFTCAGTDGMPDRGRTGWNPDVSADGRIPGRGI